MPVVKADGYGHGAAFVSRRLMKEGAESFAVAVVEEGAELRREGIEGEILVMGHIGAEQLPELVRHELVPNAHSLPLLADLASFAAARGIHLGFHLKMDTGMTRLGVLPGEVSGAIEILRASRGALRLEGLFQNFASADDPDSPQTPAQLRTFAAIHETLVAAGCPPAELHVANSAGTLRPPEWLEALPPPARVRPGLALYAPFPGLPGPELHDVMSFVSVVDQVKRVPFGTRVGYGGTFVASRDSVLAIVPAGYADGVPRSLFEKGEVVVNGARCRIAGRISMDLTAVDVTDLDPVPSPGDDVLFFGTLGHARLPVDEMASAAGTVSWEILCGVGPRVPRVLREEGVPDRVISRFFPAREVRIA